jgi:hypothetical protein
MNLILKDWRLRCLEGWSPHSWFETARKRLLTMRVPTASVLH